MRIRHVLSVSCCLAFCMGCKGILDADNLCTGADNQTAKVEIVGRFSTMKVGETVTLHSQATNRRGGWNACLPPASWTSSDTTIVRIQLGFPYLESDKAIAVRAGTVYLKAKSQEASDSMLVQVRD